MQIARGEYGKEHDRSIPDFRLEGFVLSYKYVLTIHYSQGHTGVIFVDVDGTVYFVRSDELQLMKTKPGAVDPDDFKGAIG